jgi:DNA-binding protein H-NS
MALKSTINSMRELLEEMGKGLEKTEKGNKAAAQRVRTQSIQFAKISKVFRKESIAAVKGKATKKTTKKTKKTARKTKKAKK